ncbi:MAG: radical SAM protein [Desulfobacterales bacterium RIFOXYA12_FULL_46_15]|nr:MAG: radical SAM protein [Desulfobacterales bacterium RIFOXYA12_FULL_46_15]
MLMIFPPIAKPCEPPAGVALLSAALKENGFPCEVVDANIEGMLHLIRSDVRLTDPWSRRAIKKREEILSELKGSHLYSHMDRYHQRVYDLNHMLAISVDQKRFKISLSDYSDTHLSSVSSRDLLKSAVRYKENPFYGFFETGLRDRVQESASGFVGLSVCYLNQALVGFALAGWIKDNFRNKKIIMGGGLISSWMSRPDYTHPFDSLIDVCIKGEGEQPLLELLGQSRGTKKHYVPDYDFVKKDLYLAPGRVLPFRASIGCYWSKCRFCPEKAETRAYSSQRASRVLEDLRTIEQKYSPDYVHLIDNAITPAFLKALSHERFSFKWYGFVRFEKDFLYPGFCQNLKESGCDMLKLGLESGDQAVLDQMNKGTDLGMVSKILKNLHQAGILTFVYLLFGTSFEDKAAARKTLEFVKAHEASIDYLNLAVFNLPKFSEDAEDLKTWEFYHGDLSLYLNFVHPLQWDRKQVKQFIQKIFKKEVSATVRKNPAFFSSNHAIFFK